MNSNRHARPWIGLLILTVCLLFLGLNGLIGGYLMLSDPYGAPMGMPVSVLEHTLFQNYIVPGIWLILVWGCGGFVALFGLWLRPVKPDPILARRAQQHWAWTLTLLLGLGLLGWLAYQVFTLPAIAPVQYVLGILAILLVGVPWLPPMRAFYRVNDLVLFRAKSLDLRDR